MQHLPLFRCSPPHRPDAAIVVLSGDVREHVRHIPDETIALVLTSPPYHLGKTDEDRVPLDREVQSHVPVIRELHRMLRRDGSICRQAGHFVDDGEVWPLDVRYFPIFQPIRDDRVVHQIGSLHLQSRSGSRAGQASRKAAR